VADIDSGVSDSVAVLFGACPPGLLEVAEFEGLAPSVGTEHVIVALRPAQEMELEEPGHAVEMCVVREPHVFERTAPLAFSISLRSCPALR
jgi:hypothetical protein